jgi:uncharacterized membrane protein (DUF485 family)
MDVGAQRSQFDWEGIEASPEFRELVAARRRFVLPATVFFLAWYLGFVLLAGYAQDFMAESVYQGLTVGYVLALSQFLMTGLLGWLYLRRADREWDPLRLAAIRGHEGPRADGGAAAEPAATPAGDVTR